MLYEQKCPNCGGAFVYDPQTGKLECPYCDSVFDVAQLEAAKQERVGRKERDEALQTMQPLPVYVCVSCGADVIAAPESGALTCPYCKNNIVITQQFSGTVKPDGIVPFQITPDHLSEAVTKYYRGKHFLPKGFFSSANIGPVTGVYVPFWVFDTEVGGALTFTGTKPGRVYRQGKDEIRETQHFRMDRSVQMEFKDLAVDASRKMADDLMDSVGPYDLSGLKEFDVSYLAGYVADRFDQTSEEMRKRSDLRVQRTGAQVATRYSIQGFSGVSIRQNGLRTNVRQARYVLLPMYLLNLEYQGTPYEFVVNGQTGKVIGRLPYSKAREKEWFWKSFAAGAAAIGAVIGLIVLL